MSYLDQSHIAASPTMFARVAQCAAEQGEADPENWTHLHRRTWAAAPDWDDAWAYAEANHPPDPESPPYDPGEDEAVITDQMILSQVQSMLA
jgi:hypothetical protein